MRFGDTRERERERSKTSRKRSDHPTLHKLNCPIFPSLSDEFGVAIPSGTTLLGTIHGHEECIARNAASSHSIVISKDCRLPSIPTGLKFTTARHKKVSKTSQK